MRAPVRPQALALPGQFAEIPQGQRRPDNVHDPRLEAVFHMAETLRRQGNFAQVRSRPRPALLSVALRAPRPAPR